MRRLARRRWRLLILPALLAACTPPRAAFQHIALPGMDGFDETRVKAALSTPIVLPRDVRASVLWLDQSADWSGLALPENTRERLLDDFQRTMSAPPFTSVSVIPTALAAPTGGDVDLDAIRSAAAHMQSDVAILLVTTTQTEREWNALALTYPALITPLVVPGDDVRVDVGAQACAIDVRTGLFLDCVQSHAEELDRFVIPAWSRSSTRSLIGAATERALVDIPQRLRARVDARIAWGQAVDTTRSSMGQVPPSGRRYATSGSDR